MRNALVLAVEAVVVVAAVGAVLVIVEKVVVLDLGHNCSACD